LSKLKPSGTGQYKSYIQKTQQFTSKFQPEGDWTIEVSIEVVQTLSTSLLFNFVDASSQVLNSKWPCTGGTNLLCKIVCAKYPKSAL